MISSTEQHPSLGRAGSGAVLHQLSRRALCRPSAGKVECKNDGRQRAPETVYLLTGLQPERLLRLNRPCWGIENRVHYVRDVALREDASRIRKGSLPRLIATIANLAISILHLLKTKNIQRRMDQLHLNPDGAVALLCA